MKVHKKLDWKFFGGPILIGFLIGVMLKIFQLIANYIGIGSEYAELLNQTKYLTLGLISLIYFFAVLYQLKQRGKS
ncbi:MAG: hypothetical protein QM527_07720 [Alphaproteobacteria bacterium]|nr:hypothetical protein [Alphaproteobacteria bacterium]